MVCDFAVCVRHVACFIMAKSKIQFSYRFILHHAAVLTAVLCTYIWFKQYLFNELHIHSNIQFYMVQYLIKKLKAYIHHLPTSISGKLRQQRIGLQQSTSHRLLSLHSLARKIWVVINVPVVNCIALILPINFILQ